LLTTETMIATKPDTTSSTHFGASPDSMGGMGM